ncbi:MAG: hypothetical protein GC160_19975 [Acidobacteria bacterium]|nr:hypothetical protein [Acidobacteriota bacterium]
MRRVLLSAVLLAWAAGAASAAADSGFAVTARAASYPIDWTIRDVVTDAVSGRVYAVGEAEGGDVGVAGFEADGTFLRYVDFPAATIERVGAAAVAPDGRLVIVGSTEIGFPQPALSRAAFVLRFDFDHPEGLEVRLLGDEIPLRSQVAQSEAVGVAVDADGAVYVSGWTNTSYYPTTPGAARVEGGGFGMSGFGPVADGFLTKLDADLETALSTFVGGHGVHCVGGSGCLSSVPHTVASQVALGSDGSIYVAGVTNTLEGLATPGAFRETCLCSRMTGDLFVARLTADVSRFEYATYVGGGGQTLESEVYGAEGATGLRVLDDGSAVVAGWTYAPNFPTTEGALQTRFGGGEDVSAGRDGVLFRLSPDGAELLFSTFLGVEGDDTIEGLERVGEEWWATGVAGGSFPGAGVGPRFVARLSPDADSLLAAVRTPVGITGGFLAASGDGVWAAGPESPRLTRLSVAAPEVTALYALANAAGSRDTGQVAPREIVSLYGVNLGPAEGAVADLSAGPPPDELAGLQLEIAGVRAGLLYAGPTQINAVATGAIKEGFPVDAILRRDGEEIARIPLYSVIWNAQAFAGPDRAAAALNPQGLPVGPDRPLLPGETVALFLSGAGVPHPFFSPVVEASIDDRSAEIAYFGQAPGLIDGVTQLNVRLPDELGYPYDVSPRPLTVLVGRQESEPVLLWIDNRR